MDGLVFTDADSSGAVAICKETSRQRATYPSNDKHLMTMENYFTESTRQPPFNLTWKTNYPGSEPGFSFRLSFFFFLRSETIWSLQRIRHGCMLTAHNRSCRREKLVARIP